MSHSPDLSCMMRKFELRAPLAVEDRAALSALPVRRITLERLRYLVREGDRPDQSCLLLAGFAFRQKLTSDGARQILSIHIPGDFVDLQGSLLNLADHNVQALTRCEVGVIARSDLRALFLDRPAIAQALWIDTLIDGSIFREWIVNLGRRSAIGRIAHLLCELARRLRSAGLADNYSYQLPMSQEELADATGLTPVHVNRMLRDLDRTGLIHRKSRNIVITDWEGLSELGDFSENYLHLDQATPGRAKVEATWEPVRPGRLPTS